VHWLCKLFGHSFEYEPPLVYCKRCGEYKHNPFRSAGGISLADVEGEIQDETGAPSADNQTLYDILANADQGTLTTSGDSIADRIDDYISNAGVDPAIVKRESGIFGFECSLANSAPREITTTTSGGAVNFTSEDGMAVNPSTTSGNTAKVKTIGPGFGSFDLRKIVTAIKPLDPTPFADDFEAGFTGYGVNTDSGAYIDFTTAEYHAGTNTAAATLPGQGNVSILIIESDSAANETRFEQRGAVNESVTVAGASSPNTDERIQVNSNGNGERVGFLFWKEMWIASK